jgi:superfamily I DNA/RNA helicase
MPPINHKAERISDVDKIKNSVHPRKVVVAGPGTGKSYLFSELIKKKLAEGKSDFLAITFIGKLGDALADDLCGLAEIMTMHGYARKFVLNHCPGWKYYPKMLELIKEDLKAEGIDEFEIGDANYKRRTKHYKAVGDADVVHYAVQICKKDPNKTPSHDLILIDEYQDFNAVESEFVDLLALKSEIVIVGDDDQALYEFKGSSPSFIREKYDVANEHFESRTLRFCSRCTAVIINYFHRLVEKFDLNNPAKNRIQKEYICYAPDKDDDSKANPKIHLIKNCPVGMIAYKIRDELETIATGQKIKSVLVIGEGRSCESILKGIAGQLKNYGFRNVSYKGNAGILNMNQEIVDAYRFLVRDEASLLGWRILANPVDAKIKEKHIANAKTLDAIIKGTPSKLEKIKEDVISELETALEPDVIADKEVRKIVLFQQIKRNNIHLTRPLCNLEVTVCNILNSKGLGADIVFLVGFDQGRFPVKKVVSDSEVYQMLVALTRAKKRIYLINTIGKKISEFAECIDPNDLDEK